MTETIAIKLETEIPIPMRDGKVLYADLYKPDLESKYPVILQRTPYDKSSATMDPMLDPIKAAKAGFAMVVQDTRGRYASEGDFEVFFNEINDGYDTVEWISRQSWSTGKIGMYGASYVGATQWLAAISRPPHLTTIIPNITASNYHDGWTYQGGAFSLGFNVSWTLLQLTLSNFKKLAATPDVNWNIRTDLIRHIDRMDELFKYVPLKEFPYLKDGLAKYFYDWIDHPSFDRFWEEISIEDHHSEISTPALNVGGWYDIFLGGTIRNYTGMTTNGATKDAREGQRLVIGPWAHATRGTSITGNEYFGIAADAMASGLDQMYLRWYEYWLKGIDNGIMDEPKVKIFIMGDNTWREESEWPLKRANETNYYLHSSGNANTRHGDGHLSISPPANEPSDAYLYNPNNPVPTTGGPLCCNPYFVPNGAFDQSVIEDRSDVLVYTSPLLESDIEVTGPIRVSLWATSTAVDTDFTAKLCDVCEDGCSRNLTDGIIRARYRNSMSAPSLIVPDEPTFYNIDLWATSNCFKKGHRIRIEISSSNFPRFDRNSNTGEEISSDKVLLPALQKVLHTTNYPSYVTLPIIPTKESNLN